MRVDMNGRTVEGTVYVMNEGHHPFGIPASPYVRVICEGYKSAGFDLRILMDAVKKSMKLALEQRPKQTNLFEFRW